MLSCVTLWVQRFLQWVAGYSVCILLNLNSGGRTRCSSQRSCCRSTGLPQPQHHMYHVLTIEQRELIERQRQAALQRLEEGARRREAMQAAAKPGNVGSGDDVESGSEASDVESEESDSGGSEGYGPSSDSGSEFMFDKASSTKKRTKVLPATAAPASIEVFGEESDSGSDLTPLEGYASGSDSGSDFADFTPRGQRRCCAKTSVPAASSSEKAKGPPSKTPADTPATPVSVEVFGERGVLQAKRGPAPPTVEAFGEHGVLQAEPGPRPPPASPPPTPPSPHDEETLDSEESGDEESSSERDQGGDSEACCGECGEPGEVALDEDGMCEQCHEQHYFDCEGCGYELTREDESEREGHCSSCCERLFFVCEGCEAGFDRDDASENRNGYRYCLECSEHLDREEAEEEAAEEAAEAEDVEEAEEAEEDEGGSASASAAADDDDASKAAQPKLGCSRCRSAAAGCSKCRPVALAAAAAEAQPPKPATSSSCSGATSSSCSPFVAAVRPQRQKRAREVGDQRESLVDERVRVWWDDEKWFHGRVVEWNCLKQDNRGMHRVKYDDGELKWEFLDGPNDPVWWERETVGAAGVATAAEEAEEEAEEAPQRQPLAVIDLDGHGRIRRRQSSHQPCVPRQGPPVRIKHEDAENGSIRCPSCKSALQVGTRGCHLQTCRRTDHPGGGWFHFCFHCREDLGDGRHCNKCPMENNAETRRKVKTQNNTKAQRNPIAV